MMDVRVIKRTLLGTTHRPTGKTRHFHGTDPNPTPVELRIVQYNADSGFYLFYCDASGIEITDTYHDSLEEALAQAEWEFGITKDEWQAL